LPVLGVHGLGSGVSGEWVDVGAARAVGLLLGFAADAAVPRGLAGRPAASVSASGPAFGPAGGGTADGGTASCGPASWGPAAVAARPGGDAVAGWSGHRTAAGWSGYDLLLSGAALLAGGAVAAFGRRRPVLEIAGTAVVTWWALGAAELAARGSTLARALDGGDLDTARRVLRRLGAMTPAVRDPSTLDGPGLARAGVESVAEHTCAAVVAPLLWGAVAGAPALLAQRGVRALTTVCGPPGRAGWLGWVAAGLDGAANVVPARATAWLTAACAPVVGGSAAGAWEVWRRDGVALPQPGHARVAAAFAGALQVRLGGRVAYLHGVRERPVLGHGRTPDAGDVTRGVELSRVVGVAAAAASALVALAFSRSGSGRRRRRPLG
jgi:adenosylcobinamide-phosphate synthase